MIDKKFWATTFTLTGTIIGAGILGLPYVFSKSGYFVGLGWLVFLGIILIYTSLCMGEITLRTKGKHQLAGYAEKYLGKWAKIIMSFAVIFAIYSALLAYLIGEGQSFSFIFTGGLDYSIYFAVGFWFIMALLFQGGLKELKKIETWGVSAIILLTFAIFIYFIPNLNVDNLLTYNPLFLFLPFGVILFALLGFNSIPELRMEIMGQEKKFKNAIILGVLIPILIYAIFSFIFVGTFDGNIPEVSTLGLGNLVSIFGIFTMLTSYFVLSFALKDFFNFDLKINKKYDFVLISLIPLLIYLGVSFFNLASFVTVLGIGGIISGGLMSILILLMNKKAKKIGKRKPEYSMPLSWFGIILLGLIFIIGAIFEFIKYI